LTPRGGKLHPRMQRQRLPKPRCGHGMPTSAGCLCSSGGHRQLQEGRGEEEEEEGRPLQTLLVSDLQSKRAVRFLIASSRCCPPRLLTAPLSRLKQQQQPRQSLPVRVAVRPRLELLHSPRLPLLLLLHRRRLPPPPPPAASSRLSSCAASPTLPMGPPTPSPPFSELRRRRPPLGHPPAPPLLPTRVLLRVPQRRGSASSGRGMPPRKRWHRGSHRARLPRLCGCRLRSPLSAPQCSGSARWHLRVQLLRQHRKRAVAAARLAPQALLLASRLWGEVTRPPRPLTSLTLSQACTAGSSSERGGGVAWSSSQGLRCAPPSRPPCAPSLLGRLARAHQTSQRWKRRSPLPPTAWSAAWR
jgi:hypothetical protein